MKSQAVRHDEAQSIMAQLGEDNQTSKHPGMVRFAEILNKFVRDGTGASGYMAVTASKRRIMFSLYPEEERPSWVRIMSTLQGPINPAAYSELALE